MKNKTFILCTIAAFIAFLFFNGTWNLGICAWIFPLIFLLISRKNKPLKGFLVLAIIVMLGGILKLPGLAFLSSPETYMLDAAVTLIVLTPFIIDKIFSTMLSNGGTNWQKFASTLILPCAYATMELVTSHYFFGSYISLATSQTGLLFFLEPASIVGQAGISFVIAWFGSTSYFIYDFINTNMNLHKEKAWRQIKSPILIFISILLIFCLYGGIKISNFPSNLDTIKIAVANGPYHDYYSNIKLDTSLGYQIKALENSLDVAKKGNAKIVAFNESAFILMDTDELKFKESLTKYAKEFDMSIWVGYDVKHSSKDSLREDKAICISPNGKIEYEYVKSHLIPFIETDDYVRGESVLPQYIINTLDSKESVTSVAIGTESLCAAHLNKLPAKTDIFYNPMMETHGTDLSYETALQIRAIEHGMSIIAPSFDGYNAVYNYQGREILRVNLDQVGYQTVNFAYVPLNGVTTIYSYIGVFLDCIFPVGLIVLTYFAIKRHLQKKNNNKRN